MHIKRFLCVFMEGGISENVFLTAVKNGGGKIYVCGG